MSLQRRPFESGRLEGEREERDIISLSLNREERKWLEVLKLYYEDKSDGRVLKREAFRVFKLAAEKERLESPK